MLFSVLCRGGTLSAGETSRPTILVSIAPYKFFVERIAGNTVDVEVLVPPGASLHSYEPSIKQVLRIGTANLWLRLGDPTEIKTLAALQTHNPRLMIVDLRQNLPLINVNHHEADPHIWLSPRLVKIQAETITSSLIDLLPNNQVKYVHNLQSLIKELDALDKEITQQLRFLKNRKIMVSHPAYSYFCRDYDLQQLAIEHENKEPSPQQLTLIIEKARKSNIEMIFVQVQHNYKGAAIIAKEIEAITIILDPYSEEYIDMMRKIARCFSGECYESSPQDR